MEIKAWEKLMTSFSKLVHSHGICLTKYGGRRGFSYFDAFSTVRTSYDILKSFVDILLELSLARFKKEI